MLNVKSIEPKSFKVYPVDTHSEALTLRNALMRIGAYAYIVQLCKGALNSAYEVRAFT